MASDRHVAAATQNQALAALLFLYRVVLGAQLPWLDGVVRAKRSTQLPTVLTRDEAQAILSRLAGTPWLKVSLLYGAGLRLNECLSMRVKDIDFPGCRLIVRQSKGDKDRVTVLPQRLIQVLSEHLAKVKALRGHDLANGLGEAPLPRALAGKCPRAGYS